MLQTKPFLLPPYGTAYEYVSGATPLQSNFFIQIITHTDLDGYASAAVVIDAIREKGKDPGRWIIDHATYNEIPRIYEETSILFITDYSIGNVDFAESILDAVNRGVLVFWFDHHKTSGEFLEANERYASLAELPGLRSNDYCATYLAWVYCHQDVGVPDIVRLIDDRDCWKKQFPTSDYLNSAFYNTRMRAFKKDPFDACWHKLFQQSLNYPMEFDITEDNPVTNLLTAMVQYGKRYEMYMKDFRHANSRRNAFIARLSKFADLQDQMVVMITDTPGADVFSDLYGKYKLALSVRYDKTGGGSCTIYAAKDACITASEIATAYGGGGHAGAAGFRFTRMDPLPYFDVTSLPPEVLKS